MGTGARGRPLPDMLRLFNFVAVLALILAVVGYFRDWFEITKPAHDEYAVKLDRDRIGDDTRAARDIASKVGKSLAGRRISGTVKYVNPLTMSVVLTDGTEQDHSFKLAGDSVITRGGQSAGLLDLAETRSVAITYSGLGSEQVIEEIEILD